MKKTTIFVLALLGLLVAAVPASAAPDTFASVYVTTNTDVDQGAEALTTTGPKNCTQVQICNGTPTGDVVRWKYSSSTLSGTVGGVATTGAPLFPLESSGPVCTLPLPGNPYLNSNMFYVAAEGINNSVSLICTK